MNLIDTVSHFLTNLPRCTLSKIQAIRTRQKKNAVLTLDIHDISCSCGISRSGFIRSIPSKFEIKSIPSHPRLVSRKIQARFILIGGGGENFRRIFILFLLERIERARGKFRQARKIISRYYELRMYG